MNEFKSVLLSLDYKGDSIYAYNWKTILPDLIQLALNKEIPDNWLFALEQLNIHCMIIVCDKCEDIPYFKWLRNLYDSFLNGTDLPETPNCKDCIRKD